MFTDTITIYNKYAIAGNEHWQRHVVSGVNWTDITGSVTRKTGLVPANTFTLIIPKGALAGYVSPQVFADMDMPARSKAWTVAPKDIVVLGEVSVEITQTPSKDLTGLDHVRTVTSVDSLLHGGLAHLEVSGK